MRGEQLVQTSCYRVLTRQAVTKKEIRIALSHLTSLSMVYTMLLEQEPGKTHDDVASEVAALKHALRDYCSFWGHGNYYSVTEWSSKVKDEDYEPQDPKQYTYPHIEEQLYPHSPLSKMAEEARRGETEEGGFGGD